MRDLTYVDDIRDEGDKIVPFGKEMRKQFLFQEEWRNLNHGSFGTHPRPVHAVLQQLHTESEFRPDVFVRVTQPSRLNTSRHLLANLLNIPPSTIVLVPNATTGINTILHNLTWNPGDIILYFSTTYGSCVNTLLYLAESTPVQTTQIPLYTPSSLNTPAILAAITSTIQSQRAVGLTPRALLLDTIVSQPGILLPFPQLISLCRDLGIYSIVDAAHGIGHIPLDLTMLNPDFLVTNTHKWLFVPRACAVMYVPERNQHLIRSSMPTSANFVPRDAGKAPKNPLSAAVGAGGSDGGPEGDDNTRFVKLFEYVGTLDNLPYLCIPAALEFRNEVCGGEEKIQEYCADLATKGALKVAEFLRTEILDNEEETLRTDIAMVNVRLPLDPKFLAHLTSISTSSTNPSSSSPTNNPSSSSSALAAAQQSGSTSTAAIAEENPLQAPAFAIHVANWMQAKMVEEFNTFIAIGWWNGCFWARLSAQVYLDLDDFVWAGNVLGELCERVRGGEWLE